MKHKHNWLSQDIFQSGIYKGSCKVCVKCQKRKYKTRIYSDKEWKKFKTLDKPTPEVKKAFKRIMKIEKNQSHQVIMIPTSLIRKINKVAKYLRVNPEEWIIDRLTSQLSRFHKLLKNK